MTVGQRVRLERIRLGLTQEELARVARVHRYTIMDVEADRRHMQPMTIHKLASALGIDPQELLR